MVLVGGELGLQGVDLLEADIGTPARCASATAMNWAELETFRASPTASEPWTAAAGIGEPVAGLPTPMAGAAPVLLGLLVTRMAAPLHPLYRHGWNLNEDPDYAGPSGFAAFHEFSNLSASPQPFPEVIACSSTAWSSKYS